MENLLISHHKVQLPGSTSYTKITSDRGLISAFQQGDQSAFECLFLKYKDRVFYQCLRKVRDHAESADLAQEVFLKVFRSLKNYQPVASFPTWLYRVTVNCCFDHLRKKNRRRKQGEVLAWESSNDECEIEIPDSTFNPEQCEINSQLGECLAKALAKLPEILRTVIVLRDVEGLTCAEIGRALGCAQGTVKSRLFRGRSELRRLLAPVIWAWN